MDEKTFEEKYYHFKEMVFKICYSYLNNSFDAEDATQDTFIRYYRKNKRFDSINEERYYLIRITINVCKSILKTKKNRKTSNSDMDKISDEYSVPNSDNILDYIYELKDKYKEIILYRFVEDLSHKAIAKLLKISEENARKRLQRALEELKKMWR